MTLLDAMPCQNWPPIWCVAIPTGGPLTTGFALQAATEVLWARSGRQFGECEVTLRPCRRTCFNGDVSGWNDLTGARWPFPTLVGGSWFNLACGGCGDTCACATLEEAMLPWPVSTITEIKVNGSVLTADKYRVDDHEKLLRLDGGSWPLCNDLRKDDTQPGTWSVKAKYGVQVPTLGQLAVGQLAVEFMKACAPGGSASCVLPANVQQLVRQGVTISFGDVLEGPLNLYYPDLFVGTFNPSRLQSRAGVIDLDGPSPPVRASA